MRTAEYGKKPLWIAFSLILCVLAAGVLAAWHYLLAPYRYPSGAVPFDYRIVLFLNRFARRSWAFDTFVGLLDSNPLAMAPVVLAFWWAWFRKSENQVRDREYLIFGIVVPRAPFWLPESSRQSCPFASARCAIRFFTFNCPMACTRSGCWAGTPFPAITAPCGLRSRQLCCVSLAEPGSCCSFTYRAFSPSRGFTSASITRATSSRAVSLDSPP